MSRGNKTYNFEIFYSKSKKNWKSLIDPLGIEPSRSGIYFLKYFLVLETLDKLISNILSRGNKMTKFLKFCKFKAFLSQANSFNGPNSTKE